jgi:hypothetical protein
MADRRSRIGSTLTVWLTAVSVMAWCGIGLAAEAKKTERPSRRGSAAEGKGSQTPGTRKRPEEFGDRDSEERARPVESPRTSDVRTANRRAIIEALRQPTSLQFSEESFQNVIDHLATLHKINIQFDIETLQEVGFATHKQFTVTLKGVSLQSALDLLLRAEGLAWTIYDEVLLITTPEKRASAYLTEEVYNVADLVACQDEKGQPWDDFDTMIGLITSHIEPTLWDSAGGPAAISGSSFGSAKVLVITHHAEAHLKVEQLLARIRAVGAESKGSGKPPMRARPQISPPQEKGISRAGKKLASIESQKVSPL